MFYLTTLSTHFSYGCMESDIWLRTILIVRKETRCHHIGYFFWLTARVLLYAPSHRQDSTYHGLCCTSHGALAGTRNSSMGPRHGIYIKEPMERVAHVAAVGFLSCYLSGPLPYVWCHITINVLSVLLNKTFPSFLVGVHLMCRDLGSIPTVKKFQYNCI